MQITLIPGGYRIDGDGFRVLQAFDPSKPFIDGAGQPFDSDEAALAHAQAVVDAQSDQPAA